jgi:phosphate starvation-inducible PhoH-like protein
MPSKAASRKAAERPAEIRFEPIDNSRLARLCGALDANLRQIESALDVSISRRGAAFSLKGEKDGAADAARALEYFYAKTAAADLSLDDVQLGLTELRHARARAGAAAPGEPALLLTRRPDLHGRTPRQDEYIKNILAHDITFGIGPAGTGKTFLAVAGAVDALERDTVQRIVLVRPAVEAGERLGFLPGDLAQKVDPYLRPLYDALYEMLGVEKVLKLLEKNVIEIAPLAYMRGRTLNDAYVILDEAQNTTIEQMKMFLTRLGFGSTAVVTGDLSQIDLPKHMKSGLRDAVEVLHDVDGVSFTFFESRDVVRHPLVARIVNAYEARDADNANADPSGSGATA